MTVAAIATAPLVLERSAQEQSDAALTAYMRELHREDTRLERDVAELYASALDLLGMASDSADFGKNILEVVMASSTAPSVGSMSYDQHTSSLHGDDAGKLVRTIDDATLGKLVTTVKSTRDAAEELCHPVRTLDLTASRIQATLALVTELLEVRECGESIGAAIANKDYETAAKCVAKYKSATVVSEQHEAALSKDGNSSGTSASRSREPLLDEEVLLKLEDGKRRLAAIVSEQFEVAIKNKDQVAVSRFAKLFYPLGLADSAVTAYIQFIRDRIRETATASVQKLRRLNLGAGGSSGKISAATSMPAYAETLWSVFAHISEILQQNKDNIETEFGIDNYVDFLRGIYAEVSIQQTKILTLFKEQEYNKMLLDVQQNQQKKAAGSMGGGRSSAAAPSGVASNKEKIRLVLSMMQALLQKSETFDCFIRRLITDAHMGALDSGADHYDSTTTAAHHPVVSSDPELMPEEDRQHQRSEAPSRTSTNLAKEREIEGIVHSIVGEAEATRAAQDLVSHYVLLQSALLQVEVQTALDLDEVDVEDPDPGPSSLVDNVFFVLKTTVEASMETCNLVAVCCIINEVGHVLAKDSLVYQRVQENLRESLPAYRAFVSDARHVRDPPDEGEKHALDTLYRHLIAQKGASGGAIAAVSMLEQVAGATTGGGGDASPDKQGGANKSNNTLTSADSWPHASNNAYKCVEYINRLVENIKVDFATKTDDDDQLLFPEDLETEKKTMFDHTLQNLQMFRVDFQALCSHIPVMSGSGAADGSQRRPIPGIPRNTVFVLKHHLIPSLQPFEENSFNISEAEFNDWQINDLFVNTFIAQVSMLHTHIKRCYTPEVVLAILEQLIEQSCNRLATNIAKKQNISLYGGLQFDQDVRSLMNYFLSIASAHAAAAEGGEGNMVLEPLPVRKKFKRLCQIASLLSLEHARELRDFFSQSKWELRNHEIRLFLLLRFGEAEVERDAGYLRSGGPA
ncbi:unnamed protein product [Amoebophrya sp. A25]|nr:unnamed protein product [Amoebophrya sp. A25]|eukprot:GSA25T00018896001.1